MTKEIKSLLNSRAGTRVCVVKEHNGFYFVLDNINACTIDAGFIDRAEKSKRLILETIDNAEDGAEIALDIISDQGVNLDKFSHILTVVHSEHTEYVLIS